MENDNSDRDSSESSSDSSVDSGVFTIGSRVRAEVKKSGKWALAEIIDVKEVNGETQYYVHYIAHLGDGMDEWLPKSCLNIIYSKKTSSSSITLSSLSSLSSLSDEDDPSS